MTTKHDEQVNKSLFRELPYNGVNILVSHDQFNNSLSLNHTAKNYLDKLVYMIWIYSI